MLLSAEVLTLQAHALLTVPLYRASLVHVMCPLCFGGWNEKLCVLRTR